MTPRKKKPQGNLVMCLMQTVKQKTKLQMERRTRKVHPRPVEKVLNLLRPRKALLPAKLQMARRYVNKSAPHLA